MGAVAERLADRVMLTDDNPRSEDGDEIIRQILDGTQVPEQINIERDRAQAMRQVITEAAPVDVIAICGKGHETTQTIADEVRPFNDREMAGRLLQEVWPCEA